MKITQRHGKPAFTLIELMAVITIIVILAGLVVGGLGFVTERQAKEKARVQLALLGKGLEAYKLDMGVYPASANSSDGLTQSNKCLYQALFYEGYDYNKQASPPASWTKATAIYVTDLDPTTSKQGWVPAVTGTNPVIPTTSVVSDPWGNEYRYRSAKNTSGGTNSSTINPDFDLWSVGKDAKTNASPAHKDAKDDIRNF
jgi:prepilin-type N-terminal cleavage/methylation domain-containing protein